MSDKKLSEDERRKAEDANTSAKGDATDRNQGRGVEKYDEKHPNPNDIHSDDPLVAGLANGARQSDPDDANVGTVK